MISLNPQFIKDTAGNNLVVLSQFEFDTIIEEIEDVKLFDIAQKNDDGERIPMEKAFRMIEMKRNL